MNRPPSTIQVVCPQCHTSLSVPAATVGTTVTCPDCLEDFFAKPVDERSGSAGSSREPPVAPSDADEDALQRLLNPHLEDSSSELGSIRLDDDLTDEDYPRKRKNVLECNYEFTVTCVICGTRVDVNDSQIGEKVKCPDCYSAIEVRTPPHERRRAPAPVAPNTHDDDDFGLGPVTHTTTSSSPYHAIANDLIAKAESEVARQASPATRPKRDPALDAMQRAEASLAEADEPRPKLPRAPFRTSIMRFLLDPVTIGRLIVLGVVFYIELGTIQSAITSADGSPQSQFISVLFRIVAITVGAVFATNLAVSLLSILQDTAHGKDVIESWPDVNFLDWLGEAMYIFSALFIAVFPACGVAQLVSLFGASDPLYWIVCIVGSSLGVVLLFPFVLVSMLETGSPLAPVSRPITRSVRLTSGSWIVFTLLSGVVVGAGLGLVAVRILWPGSSVMNFVIALLLIVVLTIYFRLLGRLIWCCDEAILAADIRAEAAEIRAEQEVNTNHDRD